MNHRDLLAFVTGAALRPLAAKAQPAAKVIS
jgi:hypothetical protein